jgi:hypothetical protein
MGTLVGSVYTNFGYEKGNEPREAFERASLKTSTTDISRQHGSVSVHTLHMSRDALIRLLQANLQSADDERFKRKETVRLPFERKFRNLNLRTKTVLNSKYGFMCLNQV